MLSITGDAVASVSLLACPACGLMLEYAAWPPVGGDTSRPVAATWDCVRRHAAFLPAPEWQSLRLQQIAALAEDSAPVMALRAPTASSA